VIHTSVIHWSVINTSVIHLSVIHLSVRSNGDNKHININCITITNLSKYNYINLVQSKATFKPDDLQFSYS